MIAEIAHCQLDLSVDEILKFILQLPPSSYPALLDSCQYQDYGLYNGRYLIAAYQPESCVQIAHDQFHQFSANGETIFNDNSLNPLHQLLDDWQLPDNFELPNSHLPCASGAALGFFSYDLGRKFEHLPVTAISNHFVPDLFLAFYSQLIIHDYLTAQTTLIVVSQQQEKAKTRLQTAKERLMKGIARIPSLMRSDKKIANKITSNFSSATYQQAVSEIKDQIARGNIYQANLTQQFQVDLNGLNPAEIFLRLRENFPVPFAAYLLTPSWAIVSGSPERFLQRSGRLISAYPIKGTRRRGEDSLSDQQLAAELLSSEKDIAENIMIVDLLRNDLGRICEIGSIDASQLLSLQKLPTVFHLVSKVTGTIKKDRNILHILRAAFPCGSITGAPKISAMRIIEELEGVRRGLSMGSIGWIGYNNDLDLNVAIRTLFISNGRGYFNVGGGVVADSDPLAEYEESMLKASALFQSLGLRSAIYAR